MSEVILHNEDGVQVVAFYINGKLDCTRTYINDPDGFLEKVITVYANGEYVVQHG